MKTLLAIALYLLLSLPSGAQKMHFTDRSNMWKEMVYSYNDGLGLIEYFTFWFQKDSVIDSKEYRVFNFITDMVVIEGTLIREDPILGKLYMRDENIIPGLDSDVVIMDYNLGVSDTLSIQYTTFCHFTYVVTALDSTLINSVWHRVWHFTENLASPGGPRRAWDFIEGIGCIQHPLYMIRDWNCAECPTSIMYCFSNKETSSIVSPGVHYSNLTSTATFDNTTSCAMFYSLNVKDTKGGERCIISPNPVSAILQIKAATPIRQLTICNALGRNVYNGTYNSNEITVDVSGYNPGVYLIKINGTENMKFVKK